MPSLVEIPLDVGVSDSIDSKLLPTGTLKVCENLVLRRDGQLEVRPGDTALPLTTISASNLRAFDVANHNERLFVIGEDAALSYPTNLYEYIAAVETWRAVGAGSIQWPWTTLVRDVGTPVDQDGSVQTLTVGAYNGICCATFNATSGSFAHVFRADADQTITYKGFNAQGATEAKASLKAVATTTGIFWVVGLDSGGTRIGGYPFNAATDNAFPVSNTALFATGNGIVGFDVAPITSGTGGFVVVCARNDSTITIKKFNDAGVQQGGDITGPAELTSAIALYADSGDNALAIVYRQTSTDLIRARTFNFTTGAGIAGVSSIMGGIAGSGIPSVVRATATGFWAAATLTDTTPQRVRVQQLASASLAAVTASTLSDALLQSTLLAPTETPAIVCYAHQAPTGSASNHLIGMEASNQHPLISKDFELSATTTTFPQSTLVRDAVTSKVYWANPFRNNDGNISAQVTECSFFSTARRQSASLANLSYFAGGMPMVFDGRVQVEQGFTERPRNTSTITSSAAAGSLTLGGKYTYVLTWEWTDADRNIHRSAPSVLPVGATFTIQLGATHNTVTYPASTPHSYRVTDPMKLLYGSSVRVILWRNTCSVVNTAATLTSNPVNPPLTPLNGKHIDISVDSGLFQPVNFGVGDVNPTAIAATINAATTGLTATVSGDRVVITSDTTGTSSRLFLFDTLGTGALDILGWASSPGSTLGLNVLGTSVTQPGPNLHRSQTLTLGVADLFGGAKTFTDTTSDTVLRTREVLYTQSQTPLPHHAPTPYDYVWPAGDALLVGGQPRRSAYTRSKRLFNAEPIEFADPGRLNFGGRANADVTAVAVLDNSNLIFSRSAEQSVDGDGPDHSGLGEFFAPTDVPADGGIADWRPLVRTTEGMFMLVDADPTPKLYLQQRGGAAVWIGFAVQDVIDAFPVIVAAYHIRAQNQVCFACNNTAGNAGVILRYDLRKKVWFTHTVAGAMRGLTQYQGRLVYVLASSGAVMLADTTAGVTAARIRTGSTVDFASLGYGAVSKIGLLAEWRGACSVEPRISYDDAKTFVSLGIVSLVAGFSLGDSVSKLWTPARQRTDRFVLEVLLTNGTPTAMIRLNKLVLEVERAPGTTRLGAASNR